MATLAGQTIAASYEQLLSLPDGGGNGTTRVAITDGDAGTTFTLSMATTSIAIGAGHKLYLDGLAAGGNTYIWESTADVIDIYAGGDLMISIDGDTSSSLENILLYADSTNIRKAYGTSPAITIQPVDDADGDTVHSISMGGDDWGGSTISIARTSSYVSFLGIIAGIQHYHSTAKTIASDHITIDMAEGPIFSLSGEGGAADYLDGIVVTRDGGTVTPEAGMTIYLTKSTGVITLRDSTHGSVSSDANGFYINCTNVTASSTTDKSWDQIVCMEGAIASSSQVVMCQYKNAKWQVLNAASSLSNLDTDG